MKLFCAGVGPQHPDIEDASRRMKKSEFDECVANGVKDIAEIQVGLDGVAFAESKNGASLALTPRTSTRPWPRTPMASPTPPRPGTT
jgi:phosphate transport system substrate-binding protein